MKGAKTVQTFTINGAAGLLEKDRETLVRALRDTPPDVIGKGRGREQWKLPTIIAALERHAEGGASSLRARGNKNRLSDEEFMTQMFNITEAWTRASDAIVAIGEMPKESRQAESSTRSRSSKLCEWRTR
jgi:hypothetical protein